MLYRMLKFFARSRRKKQGNRLGRTAVVMHIPNILQVSGIWFIVLEQRRKNCPAACSGCSHNKNVIALVPNT